jgi:hypothetical protein
VQFYDRNGVTPLDWRSKSGRVVAVYQQAFEVFLEVWGEGVNL